MYVVKKDSMKVPLKIWSEEGSIEPQCLEQMERVSSLPFLHKHVALMPDAHLGIGASIGSVVATNGEVLPVLVGVDIGCGMCAVKTSLTEIDKDTLKKIMGEIRKVIPVGFKKHEEPQDENLMPQDNDPLGFKTPIVNREYVNALKSLGTLGSGNHFIEIQKGDDGHIWIMLHSGSRNLGYKVANHYNRLAKELNKKWHSVVPKEWDLAYLPIDSEEGKAYIKEMEYCVEYALANRKLMMDRILKVFLTEIPSMKIHSSSKNSTEDMINIAHNYIEIENHFGKNVFVHRKGATLVHKGTIGIIPGSQGSFSYVVKGKGNKDSFESCSHGAGRTMSRKKAKEVLSLSDEIKKLDDLGVVHGLRNTQDLDEAAGAYKDVKQVMANQTDLVDIMVELTPIAVIKA